MSWGYLISGAINACTQLYLEESRQKLQERLAEKNHAFQAELSKITSDRNIEVQMLLAQQTREAQANEAKETRKNSRDIAIYSAKEAEKRDENNRDEIEYLKNYPLTIRKHSFLNNLEQAEFLPVKIVLAPPTISDTGTGFNDCEKYINSSITNFFQKEVGMPVNYYHFLSGAWKSNLLKGVSAYQNIHKEFSDEPFLIVDCEISRGKYFTFNLCFWNEDIQKASGLQYMTYQFFDKLDFSDMLRLSARERAKSIYDKYIASGKGKDVAKILSSSPQDIRNVEVYMKEKELLEVMGVDKIIEAKYDFLQEDYENCLEVVSKLASLVSGVVVDMYQLTSGASQQSYILNILSKQLDLLPETEKMPIRSFVAKWIINDYYQLATSNKIDRNITVKLINQVAEANLSILDNYPTLLNDKFLLPENVNKIKHKKNIIEEAFSAWCNTMGVTVYELSIILMSEEKTNIFRNSLSDDLIMVEEIKKIYKMEPLISNNNEVIRKVYELVT